MFDNFSGRWKFKFTENQPKRGFPARHGLLRRSQVRITRSVLLRSAPDRAQSIPEVILRLEIVLWK